jgi:hypothetical protein
MSAHGNDVLLAAASKCEEVRDAVAGRETWTEEDKRRAHGMFARAADLLRTLAQRESPSRRREDFWGGASGSGSVARAGEGEADVADPAGPSASEDASADEGPGRSDEDAPAQEGGVGGPGLQSGRRPDGTTTVSLTVVARAYKVAAEAVQRRMERPDAQAEELCATFVTALRVRLQRTVVTLGLGEAATSPHLVAEIKAECDAKGWGEPEIPRGPQPFAVCYSRTNCQAGIECPEEAAIVVGGVTDVAFERGSAGPEPKRVHVTVTYARGSSVDACKYALRAAMAALQSKSFPTDVVHPHTFELVPPPFARSIDVAVRDGGDCAGMDLTRRFLLRGSDALLLRRASCADSTSDSDPPNAPSSTKSTPGTPPPRPRPSPLPPAPTSTRETTFAEPSRSTSRPRPPGASSSADPDRSVRLLIDGVRG